jgi:hypothetical protein
MVHHAQGALTCTVEWRSIDTNQETEMDRLVIRSKEHQQELSGIGARESEMDVKDTIPQRIDNVGTKLEDLAGTGEGDSPGG